MLVQKLRLQRGWSQEQLAIVSGLSVRTIQRIERGQSASLETLATLASVFEIDVSQLTVEKETDMQSIAVDSREAEEALAFERVRKIKKFYLHVAQYVLVIAMLVVINLVTSPHYFWAIWPALGWGVALAMNGMTTFDLVPFLNAAWERKKVEDYLGRKL
ncbi:MULTISPECIES: 2TM domain-containing protein [Rhizobium/Agrobacterium group]|uniref:Helix-turn-helix domain-containing protein n=1 Tax=Rhizobium rhizogenes TaxID=359 RepID=A0AA92C712_RHIRH|nr:MULTISPECIES: 2TM domain-containing protein [Rhizobium/Agrobacterium group]KQR33924.1 XRE family transcriptional regulator [Rhizobium sp. Leaf155]PVE57091.1 helix-turn-helix domain-containing protein [Rhizobium rhizogenes]PVE68395.1 helix-turn-helix domain-containing protein [Agrobacterium tumefaciens]PVE78143.1 helix-turn-helix domain-containing protein [Sphingomonas sp. TPD3009]